MKLLSSFLLLLASSSVGAAVSDHQSPPKESPCIARSPTTGLYFDLNTISLLPLEQKAPVRRSARDESWHARGHDYGTNFTLNFCAPVVENLRDVVGLEKSEWKNVGAYYVKNGKTYSIGHVFFFFFFFFFFFYFVDVIGETHFC